MCVCVCVCVYVFWEGGSVMACKNPEDYELSSQVLPHVNEKSTVFLQATESWAEPGNEARIKLFWLFRPHSQAPWNEVIV